MINLHLNFSFTYRERQKLVYTVFGIKILSAGFRLIDKSTALAIRSIWDKVAWEEDILLEDGH